MLRFLLASENECGYLPSRKATNVFVHPETAIDPELFKQLMEAGFRRSGQYLYRPNCYGCRACTSTRVSVEAFKASRSQRRNWKANADLTVIERDPEFDEVHFQLYLKYLEFRHPGSSMGEPDREKYIGFLTSEWSNTRFFEFSLNSEVVMVAVADQVPDILSAVYTFYNPDLVKRGLGVFGILWEIERAKDLGLHWVHLGYWINNCDKMSYKVNYRPVQLLLENHEWATREHCSKITEESISFES